MRSGNTRASRLRLRLDALLFPWPHSAYSITYTYNIIYDIFCLLLNEIPFTFSKNIHSRCVCACGGEGWRWRLRCTFNAGHVGCRMVHSLQYQIIAECNSNLWSRLGFMSDHIIRCTLPVTWLIAYGVAGIYRFDCRFGLNIYYFALLWLWMYNVMHASV